MSGYDSIVVLTISHICCGNYESSCDSAHCNSSDIICDLIWHHNIYTHVGNGNVFAYPMSNRTPTIPYIIISPPPPSYPTSAAYIHQWTGSALVQAMSCRLLGAKPLPVPILAQCHLELANKFQWNSNRNTKFRTDENAFENVVY